MRLANLVGTLMIVLALLLGAIGAFGLYSWEATSRTASLSLLYTPTPLPPAPTPTPQPGTNPPAQGTITTAPPSSAVDTGANIFTSKCDACHPKANAGDGPALHGASFTATFPNDADLREMIRRGRDGMPAFGADALNDADLDAVIAYLRSLQ